MLSFGIIIYLIFSFDVIFFVIIFYIISPLFIIPENVTHSIGGGVVFNRFARFDGSFRPARLLFSTGTSVVFNQYSTSYLMSFCFAGLPPAYTS